jgi:hypothetical protein
MGENPFLLIDEKPRLRGTKRTAGLLERVRRMPDFLSLL